MKNYWLPIVTEKAEPQERGAIARAWIIDLKIYPGMPMPIDGVSAGGDSNGYKPFFIYFLLIILVSFPHKNTTNNLRIKLLYTYKCKNSAISSIYFFHQI